MIFENIDNKKNRTKRNDAGYQSYDDALLLEGMEPMKKRTTEKLNYLTTPVDNIAQEQHFNNSFANYMLPKDTPERHRKNYALSNEALDDVVGDYYNNTLKNSFENKREASKKKEREEYMRYAAVPGANPVNAYKASVRVNDPMRVVDEAMNDIDDDYLLNEVKPLASYGGYDAKEYVDKFVKPSLREKMIGEYVKENTPKSSAEYVMRSSFDNSLMGKLGAVGMNGEEVSRNNRILATEGVANYDANKLENFAGGVGSLLIDSPVFSGLGSLSSAVVGGRTAKAMEKISNKVLSRYKDRLVSKAFADGVARKIVVDRLKNRILQGTTTQGLTLGGYDVANSVADDILNNGAVNVGKAAGAFARGFATGAAVGATGTAIKARTQGLTGGKKLLSSAGVLSAESAVFTAGGELEKLAHGAEIKPIDLLTDFGESTATLLTMRMANWRPKGAAQKLNAKGEIKDELKLSNSERQELRERNVNPEQFVSMLEKELRMPVLGSNNARLLKEGYVKLMSSKGLSASAKSKLMYLVENKITSTPPVVFDYEAEKLSNGSWNIRLLDPAGGLVEVKHCGDAINAKSNLLLIRAGVRKNRIAFYERELSSAIDSQNFLKEAGLYAKEKDIDIDVIAEAMYKSARKEKLDNLEQHIMNEIMERSAHSEIQISKSLLNARREIEQRYNLERGRLLGVIDKSFIECSTGENKALDEYEAFVCSEYEKTKNRTDATVVDKASEGELLRNDDIKRDELEDYLRRQNSLNAGQTETVPPKKVPVEKPLNIPENKPGYVWNMSGRDIKKETVEEFERYGKEFAGKFGQEIEFITDEHQIKRPDADDATAVREYNNQLRAMGWVHKGKVFINLPNIKDYADLENAIVHEVVGHVGLKKVFGRYMYDFIEDVYKTADGSVRYGIEKIKNRYRGVDIYTATEEYLVSLVEKTYPTAKERNLLVRFKDFIKSMLVRHNIYKPKYRRVGEKELKSIMEAHCRYVLNKKEQSQHRNDVFNRFNSAHFAEEGYYNPEAYARYKTEMLKNGSYMKMTPEKMMMAKYLVNYPYLPENVREKIMKATKMSDEELREQSEGANYRFEGKKGAKNYSKVYPDEPGRSVEDAEFYEKHGFSPRSIKRFTGWERGADGEWRREVAETGGVVRDYIHAALFDNKPELAELYEIIKEVPKEAWGDLEKSAWDKIIREGYPYMKNAFLPDVVSDNDFFISYPELVDMPVKIVTNAPALVRYDSKNKEMVVDRDLFVSPQASGYMAAALQNVVQDYEGFSKAVSLRLLSLEGRLAKRYKNAQKCIAIIDGVRRHSPSFDKDAQIEKAFEREFGVDISTFKRMYPTYDDFLFHKLTGKNYSLSGNVEMNNVRKRYDMNNGERNKSLAAETEFVPRDRQIVIKDLKDLEKYFTGPLDIINSYLQDVYSDEPIKLKKVNDRLNKANLTPIELAEFDATLDRYTKSLLREMLHGKETPDNSYGYEKYRDRVLKNQVNIREDIDEYKNIDDIVRKLTGKGYEHPDTQN